MLSYCSGYPLWQQEPPRDHIAVPSINNHIDILVKQIASYNFQATQSHIFTIDWRLSKTGP